MHSASVLDRPASTRDVLQVHDLLLLWQHPESHEIVPIGRLLHECGAYTFCYTRAAASVAGLRPLPGLHDLHRRYTSERIPAVFSQRVMEPDRPDYAEYLASLGLDPALATPWEQIVHSGGERAGDTLRFMPVPSVEEGRARARFLVSGVRHIPHQDHMVDGRVRRTSPVDHESALRRLSPGDTVSVDAEDGNSEDADATLVTLGGVPLGWVPRILSASMRELLESGPVRATVIRVGDPGTPSPLRLVVDLDASAPSEFLFDREGNWEPLVTQ